MEKTPGYIQRARERETHIYNGWRGYTPPRESLAQLEWRAKDYANRNRFNKRVKRIKHKGEFYKLGWGITRERDGKWLGRAAYHEDPRLAIERLTWQGPGDLHAPRPPMPRKRQNGRILNRHELRRQEPIRGRHAF